MHKEIDHADYNNKSLDENDVHPEMKTKKKCPYGHTYKVQKIQLITLFDFPFIIFSELETEKLSH